MTVKDEILKAVETFKAEQLSISSVEILLSELVRIANESELPAIVDGYRTDPYKN